MKLPDFIKKIRTELLLTQVQMAKKIKLRQSTISCWENGSRDLSPKSSRKLVKFCSEHGIQIPEGISL